MRVFEIKPRFDQETGEPCGTMEKLLHHRCDYCGQVLSRTEEGYCPQLAVNFDYGDSDPNFGSGGDEYKFGEEHGVRIWSLFEEPFCFCNYWNNDEGQWPCEGMLALEFISKFDDMPDPRTPAGMAPLGVVDDLWDAFRSARVRAATKLIKDGTVTVEQLGLEKK